MFLHRHLSNRQVFQKIKSGKIKLGGNSKLRIYGKLHCKSGKRIKVENRVFFETEQEAKNEGFRPCSHCLRNEYLIWKKILR
jgi:Metal binding domain of Ada